jgi:hypothetical protein
MIIKGKVIRKQGDEANEIIIEPEEIGIKKVYIARTMSRVYTEDEVETHESKNEDLENIATVGDEHREGKCRRKEHRKGGHVQKIKSVQDTVC